MSSPQYVQIPASPGTNVVPFQWLHQLVVIAHLTLIADVSLLSAQPRISPNPISSIYIDPTNLQKFRLLSRSGSK